MNALGAASGLPIDEQRDAVIRGVRAIDHGQAIELVLDDGTKLELSAKTLWCGCPSAQGKARRMHGLAVPPENLRISAMKDIGRYAVNIAFSDGHDRGIYPWVYLLNLAKRPQLEDFIIAS